LIREKSMWVRATAGERDREERKGDKEVDEEVLG
jgi:hypothetical protein